MGSVGYEKHSDRIRVLTKVVYIHAYEMIKIFPCRQPRVNNRVRDN